MAGPYYRMPSGKLPMIDGKPVFITEAEFLDCCCQIPSCPEFPEDEILLDSYYRKLTQWTNSTCTNVQTINELRLVSPAILTLYPFPLAPCNWSGSAEIEFKTDEGDWTEGTRFIQAQFVESQSQWQVAVVALARSTAFKNTGTSPLGSYSDLEECYQFNFNWFTREVSATVS